MLLIVTALMVVFAIRILQDATVRMGGVEPSVNIRVIVFAQTATMTAIMLVTVTY